MAGYHFDVITKRSLEEDQVLPVANRIYAVLGSSRYSYPHFRRWYFGKFVEGLCNGSRTIIVCRYRDAIAGVALLKCDSIEKKICTLEVHREYRRIGLGKQLFQASFDVLNTSKPLITVSSGRMSAFSSIMRYFRFSLESVLEGYYRSDSTEYVFNGILSEENPSPDGTHHC